MNCRSHSIFGQPVAGGKRADTSKQKTAPPRGTRFSQVRLRNVRVPRRGTRVVRQSERVITEAGEDHVVGGVRSADAAVNNARHRPQIGVRVLDAETGAAVVAIVELVPDAGRDLLDELDIALTSCGGVVADAARVDIGQVAVAALARRRDTSSLRRVRGPRRCTSRSHAWHGG